MPEYKAVPSIGLNVIVKGFYESVGLLMTGATTNTFSGFDPVINDDILSKILIPIK